MVPAFDGALPPYASTALETLVRLITALTGEIAMLDQQLTKWRAESEASRRLASIPGLGIITATAIAATVSDPDQFTSGRQFAAWLGLTPQQHSTGGKTRLGGISSILASIARCRRHYRDASRQGQVHAHGKLDQEIE